MKYLDEALLLNEIQNKYNKDSPLSSNLKISNSKNDYTPPKNFTPHRSILQKSYILPVEKPLKPIEKPLKSPKRLICTNAAANRLYQLHTQRRASEKERLSSSNGKLGNSQKSQDAITLSELANVFNGFDHKFTNENSSIRAYKTFGHTTLSFASIISMKNRPLLDRRVISESNLRKKKELKDELNRKQEQKRRKSNQLQNNKYQTDYKFNNQNMLPLSVDSSSHQSSNIGYYDILGNDFTESKPTQEVVGDDIKVEVLRTLSVSEEGRLSTDSFESLKSIDYQKIEDIINEYLITPSVPIVPIRFEFDDDHLNCLNHLYDAFVYFHEKKLKQYIAWIPLNNNKDYLSVSSLLSRKHAPFVFRKTITHPKRVSSLYANYIHNEPQPNKNKNKNDNIDNTTEETNKSTSSDNDSNKDDNKSSNEKISKNSKEKITTNSNEKTINKSEPVKKEISVNTKQESVKKPSSQTSPKKKSLHSKVAESLKPVPKTVNKNNKTLNKSSNKKRKNKEVIKPKPEEEEVEIRINPKLQDNKNKVEIKIKPKPQESKVEIKLRSKSQDSTSSNDMKSKLKPISLQENSSNEEIKPKSKLQGKTKEKRSSIDSKASSNSKTSKDESKAKPKMQENKEEPINKPKTQENETESRKNSTTSENKDDETSEIKGKNQIPCKIPKLPSSNIDLNNIKIGEHTNVPHQLIRNKSSNIPTLGKYEFPFYHMYDAFDTYGKVLLRAPRAWRQLKKNVVSIASIYSYDNRPI